jgi:hypothetical protein
MTAFTTRTPEQEVWVRKTLALLNSVKNAHWSSAAPGVGTYFTGSPTCEFTMTGTGAAVFGYDGP